VTDASEPPESRSPRKEPEPAGFATESVEPTSTEPAVAAFAPAELAPAEPALEPVTPPPTLPAPPVEATRRLLGASFDLLTRTSDDMRRASFYIGVVVLGTVGPLAFASWALEVVSIHKTGREMTSILASGVTACLALLGVLAIVGLVVAAVESRAMAAAILGGRQVGRPVTVRASLARSRMVFGRVIFGSIIVGVPVVAGQVALSAVFERVLGRQTDVSVLSSTLAAAVVGAPFAYLLSGIVLGDVDPLEATRRSFRVFRARKLASALVAVFETIATALVVLGLSAGLDVALRVFGAVGLGSDSGPAGLALMTASIVAGVFALGTLLYTAYAIAVAPQIVMFVGLTHATFGLDHVRPGGDRDPDGVPTDRHRFRWLTRPLLFGFLVGEVGLVATLVILVR
jgi:hypothetical protein